jgi:hypothetical protein
MQACVAHKYIEFLINHQKQEGYWTYIQHRCIRPNYIFFSDHHFWETSLRGYSLQLKKLKYWRVPWYHMTWEVQIHPSYLAAWSPSPVAHQLLKRLKKHESRVGVLCFFEFMVWINFLLSRFVFPIKFKINSLLPPLNS